MAFFIGWPHWVRGNGGMSPLPPKYSFLVLDSYTHTKFYYWDGWKSCLLVPKYFIFNLWILGFAIAMCGLEKSPEGPSVRRRRQSYWFLKWESQFHCSFHEEPKLQRYIRENYVKTHWRHMLLRRNTLKASSSSMSSQMYMKKKNLLATYRMVRPLFQSIGARNLKTLQNRKKELV